MPPILMPPVEVVTMFAEVVVVAVCNIPDIPDIVDDSGMLISMKNLHRENRVSTEKDLAMHRQ